ncbi:MAG: hypothetical protein EBY21_09895 [Alphaproteobacteria bacterium]|nr:hypothetical protein [Alphaproteobacteria bacterium]
MLHCSDYLHPRIVRVCLALIPLAVSGCAVSPPAFLMAPAHPVQTKSGEARSLMSDAKAWPEVEPADWSNLNKEVTPKGAGR